MDAPKPDQPAAAETAEAKRKKSRWEIVLTTTPVALTVLGTILAGLSSSEMTLAQYYRTLAAQSQSKAANQWNFFQVKRIRGTSLEVLLDLLPVQARVTPLEPSALLAASDAHLRQLRMSRTAAARLQQALTEAKASLPETEGSVAAQAAGRLAKLADEQVQAAEKAHGQLEQRARAPEVQAAFKYIGSREMPPVTIAPIENEAIEKEMKEMMATGRDGPIALTEIPPGAIDAEIHRAEDNTRNAEAALEAPDRTIDELGKFVRAQLAQTVAFHQTALEIVARVDELPDSERKGLDAVRQAAGVVQQRDAALIAAGEELKGLYNAADHGYTARRYRWEANFNRQTAQLYEMQVRKHSLDAERHRYRSRLYFFGLLLAQAGTAIATMALAARLQSMLWVLASVAGLLALGFSLFVYLSV